MSFFVTGTTRSATMFLAKQLNCSSEWLVEHEPKKMYWDSERWGCVHSGRWALAKKYPCDQLAIVIRHPLRVYLSWMNVWGLSHATMAGRLRQYPQQMRFLDRLITDRAVHLFKFHEITTRPEAVIVGARALGITDLSLNQIKVDKKIHAIDRHGYTMDDVPADDRARIEDRCGWFVEKYELPCV